MKHNRNNLDVRAYIVSKGYRLADVARAMGLTGPVFSTRYMGYELPRETKDYLMSVVDRMVKNDNSRVQKN